MPRKPRLHLPGGYYHLILRGNARQPIFFDDEDRLRWENGIRQGIDRYGHRLHAYCWMTNHVHLAAQAGNDPLAGFMAYLASSYAKSTNRKIRRSGHFFERRYRAILVQEDAYLKELVRYIHLNPVRAGMVDDPADYPWSSHTAYITAVGPPWLTQDRVLAFFADSERAARDRYARFMTKAPLDDTTRLIRRGGEKDDRVLGGDAWRKKVLDRDEQMRDSEPLDDLVQRICALHDTCEAALASSSRERALAMIRAEIALAALEQGIATVTAVARRFGRSQPALSRTMKRLRENRK